MREVWSSFFVLFQSDEASAAQNLAESPIDTDPADVTEVRPNLRNNNNKDSYLELERHSSCLQILPVRNILDALRVCALVR